jgi:hypothetical protein
VSNDYKVGQVYGDESGDQWEVIGGDLVKCLNPGFGSWIRSIDYVEKMYGLKLISDVPEESITPADPEGLGDPYGMNESHPSYYDRLPQDFVQHVTRVYKDARELVLRKQADYGPKAIAEAPGGPLNGLRVRIWDKISRLNNLLDQEGEPSNESIRDTFEDLMNYSAIALMALEGTWPGTRKEGELEANRSNQ